MFCPVQQLQYFLTGIDPNKLNGFHSSAAPKFKQLIQFVTFQDIKGVLESMCQKITYKNKKNWKQQQIVLFLYIVDKACLKFDIEFTKISDQIWDTIAKLIPGRDGSSCKVKMISLVPTSLNDTPWSQVQHQILDEIIQKEGINKWKTVSLKLYEKNPLKIFRSSKQCRQRYMCFLKPDLKKGFWTDQQDYDLILLYLKFGRKWSKMAQYIHGRNQNAIKNRFSLLFEETSKNQKLYYSQFMRKVIRRKQKLQKILQIKPTQQNQEVANSQKTKQEQDNSSIFITKVQSTTETEREQKTQNQYRYQQLEQIQKFFAF